MKIVAKTVKDTVNTGFMLGKILRIGDVVCLTGDLGTGKTALTGGIAKAIGIDGYITSPTFTIINEYEGKIPLYHFDVYRIAESEEMFEIGFEEYISGNGIVVIEWAELIQEILPQEYIYINIKKDYKAGENLRIINIEFFGQRYSDYEGRMLNESSCS